MSTLVRKINNVYKVTASDKAVSPNRDLKKLFKINFIILIFIFLALFFYLIEINQIITLGFKVDELEKNKDELKKTNKSLEIEKIKLESLSNTQNQLSSIGFIKADNLEYLRPVAGVVLTQK